MDTLIGIIVVYLWVHSIIIVAKKVKNQTPYETGVLIGGATFVVLYVLGTAV